MDSSRRGFLAASVALPVAAFGADAGQHVVLLGDSIFDNGRYTNGQPDVITHLRRLLPSGWKASLRAVDGATTADLGAQLARLPADASRLVLSVGGNDALGRQQLLDMPVTSTARALNLLSQAALEFERHYRDGLRRCLAHSLPLTVCTIYNGNFPDPAYQARARTALTVFNDAIIRAAADNAVDVLDLRRVCDRPEDYANAIEPSSAGAARIAGAIVRALGAPTSPHGIRLFGP